MSLSLDPVDRFITRGQRFLESPDVATGLAFDDAVVVFKRHLLDERKDPETARMLNDFAGLIRHLDTAKLKPLFEAVVERLPSS